MSEMTHVMPNGESDQKVSFKAFQALMTMAAGGNRMVRRMTTGSYAEFVSLLYEDFDEIIGDLEGRKKYFTASSEDQISDSLISSLRQYGYQASHDKDHSGHVDITVEVSHQPNFIWLGEAKLDDGPKYCWGGFQQLTTRYSVARAGADAGGILIYLQKYKDAKSRLEQWAEYLEKEQGIACDRADPTRPGLAFSTAAEHTGTGLPYKVRHMIIYLRHDPEK
ncbi:hypothetical protein LGM58_38060 [Burkholderia contaminans]|uniref:hypothetical protein n=1 Tax=Burkholderia contaminans TaxID=488447 RepID=UPI001CF2041C|nr:hypothetical protein [Burkholderia contaminans]MCA7888988.1 hypothetical protein [Burkholderia contaminans]